MDDSDITEPIMNESYIALTRLYIWLIIVIHNGFYRLNVTLK